MASLHPELQLRTPTDSPPQRRPLKQRRTHCDLEQAWDCILRKLPMPFEHFCGAEACGVGAALLRLLAGKAASAEDQAGRQHRQSHGRTGPSRGGSPVQVVVHLRENRSPRGAGSSPPRSRTPSSAPRGTSRAASSALLRFLPAGRPSRRGAWAASLLREGLEDAAQPSHDRPARPYRSARR